MSAVIKPGFGQNRVKLSDVIPLDTPFTLNIVPSTVCNFKCIYCVHSLSNDELKQMGFTRSLMDWELFLKVCDQMMAFPHAFKSVFLYGNGEPLCNKNIPDMIKNIKKLSPASEVGFITNGSLLTEEMSDKLVDSGLDVIRISIQGLTTGKYSEICGVPLDFDKLVDQISYLYKIKKQCSVFIKTLNVSLANDEDERFYKIFGNISDRVFIEKVMPVFNGVSYEGMLDTANLTDRYGNEHEPRMVCPQTFYTLTVWPNGDVYPCDVLRDPAFLGNIKVTTLKEIWNGNKLREFQKMQLRKERLRNKICAVCCAPDDVAQEPDSLESVHERILW